MSTKKERKASSQFIKTKFENIDVYTFPIKVKDLIEIHYVAVRGSDNDKEPGAVQRILNKSRIKSIKEFILSGKMFFNTFIINWTNKDSSIKIEEDKINIPVIENSAQVIDGQHRLAGLSEAFAENPKIGEHYVITSLCIGLDTKQAASIFLNINSEQKPVPRSLVYDLFGEIEDDRNHVINRATDIATELNENLESPYFDNIKFPGKTGVVDLATVISALKGALEVKGVFHNIGLTNLERQKRVILNYFIAISIPYKKGRIWSNKNKNPFLSSAGFYGALEALLSTFLLKCQDRKSFSIRTFEILLGLENSSLMTKDDFKTIEGRTRRKAIKEYLEEHLLNSLPSEDEYEF